MENIQVVYADNKEELRTATTGCFHDHCYHLYYGQVEGVPEHLKQYLEKDSEYVLIYREPKPNTYV